MEMSDQGPSMNSGQMMSFPHKTDTKQCLKKVVKLMVVFDVSSLSKVKHPLMIQNFSVWNNNMM